MILPLILAITLNNSYDIEKLNHVESQYEVSQKIGGEQTNPEEKNQQTNPEEENQQNDAGLKAAIGALSVAAMGYFTKQIKEKTRKNDNGTKIQNKSLDNTNKPRSIDKITINKSSILSLGIGGSGKTTLINKIFDESANPEQATSIFEIYNCEEINRSQRYIYNIADYSGQNIGTLTQGILLENTKPKSSINSGNINSIIFVVDLEKPNNPGININQNNTNENWKERVNENIAQWNDVALDCVFGLTNRGNLKYVCLLINKFDTLNNIDKNDVLNEYQTLSVKIAKRCRGIQYEVLVGSFINDNILMKVKSQIKRFSQIQE